mgnify:CR=1 FL=1
MEEVILLMENIWKRFPGVVALKGVTIDVKRGEILGLVGENGAGKSTLLKILFGVYKADEGRIVWKGREVEVKNPYHAMTLGISYVPQETLLSPNLSIAENIFLGFRLRKGFSLMKYSDIVDDAKKLLSALDLDVDPMTRVGELSVAMQQLVMVARALAFNAELIVFDEPTSALGPRETERLLSVMLKLKERGISIIFVSHRIEEVLKVADRVVVLRDGKKVATFDNREKKVSLSEVVRAMIARDVKEFFPKEEVPIKEKVFEVRNLSGGKVKNVSFYVRSGEILGIFGLVGSGRTTMAQMIVGARPKKSGEVYVDGKKVIIKKPSDAIKAGIAYLPEDRRYQGLVLRMNVRDNITLPILKRIRSLSMGLLSPINRVKEEGIVSDHIGKLRIVPPDPNRKTMYLSGGNQQKVVLAKWLASRARVLILDEPTRGIDVGAKVEIRKLMVELAREGKAVILISSELMEVLGMSDRILVMADGKIVAEFERAEATPQKVMECAVKSYR